jgi:hypothetical protein
MSVKTTVTIAIRPGLKKQLDELANKVDQSRSETTCRLLGLLVPSLLLNEGGSVTVPRGCLLETLEI